MDVDLWIKLSIVVVLLALSAFFSSSESALFSLSRAVLERLGESVDPRAKRVAKLLAHPRRLLASILTGNTIVNTAAAAITALAAYELADAMGFNKNLAVLIEIVIVTIAILFLSELVPKLFALRDSERWAIRSSFAVQLSIWILSPIALPLAHLTAFLSQAFGIEKHSMLAMSEEEIHALVQVGHEHGVLEAEERKMIHSIFEFGETIVREVMIPRIDMIAIGKDTTFEELTQVVINCGHSRIPVYDEKVDNIIGIVYAKDLLVAAHNPSEYDLKKHIRPVYFVPEEKKIDDLLSEFQTEKIHIAIVVDEYGGTAGLVTMEDIIEEIVGEIQDEYDEEQPLLQQVDEHTIVADGRTSISDLNVKIGLELLPESEAYDTLAGFVFSQLGEVPEKDREFDYEGYKFIVEEVSSKRITRVRLQKEGGIFKSV